MPASADTRQQPIRTLRDWLDHLETRGRLAIMRPGIDLTFQLAAIAKRLDGEKATLFPDAGGSGKTVVSGLTSSRAWMAEAMGCSEAELLARFQHAALNPVACRETNTAAHHEIIHNDVDLGSMLPLPTHNEHDSGPYITAGLVIVRNPTNGIQNVSIHRLQLSGPRRLGALLLPRHTLAYYDMAEKAGQPLDVAVVIGVDPIMLLASQAIAPIDHDEMEIAGALHGAPIEVVKCRTNSVRVPASAEIVIEGHFLPRVREPEGPFGEFPQYYGERGDRHVIEVDAVTHRRDPIFHTIVGGGLEHLLLGGIPREATILAYLKRSFPNVRDVHLARGGVCRYHLTVQIEKRQEGEAKNVICGAFGSHYDIKQVVVVDDDVDIHDPTEVEWAVATRFQADRDLLIVPGAQGSRLDPSTDDGVGAKMGLDATRPLSAPKMRFTRIRVPGEEDVVLDQVMAAETRGGWRGLAERGR
jgi:2,5-furandicarboxylate decarboxylase 1